MSFIEDVIGYTSACALGHITFNVPGCVACANLYYRFKRKRESSESTLHSKKHKMAGHHHVPSPSESGHMAIDTEERRMGDEEGVDVVGPSHSERHMDRVREHRPVHMHVSKKFKAMVNAALAAKYVYGRKTDIYTFSSGNFFSGVQTVDPFLTSGAFFSKWDFLPEYFVDAVSVLFNGKLATANLWQFTSAGTIGLGLPIPVANVGPGALEFEVVDSWTVYRYKNNSVLSRKFMLYICEPRFPSQTAIAGYGPTAGAVVNNSALVDPQTSWTNCLTDDTNAGLNLNNITVSALHTTPMETSAWSKYWKWGLKEFVLEPGTEYEFKLQGPAGLKIKMNDIVRNGQYDTIQKYSRWVLPVILPSLESSTGGNLFGRYGNVALTDGIVGYEKTMYCKVKVPEQAGFVYPSVAAPGTAQSLGYRHPSYAHNNWTPALSGTFNTVEKQTGVKTTI